MEIVGIKSIILDVIDKKDADNDSTLFPILNSMMEEEYTTESIMIAKFIMDGLQAQIGKESNARGMKAEEWFVVRNSNMPSVLIELGFVSIHYYSDLYSETFQSHLIIQ